MFQVLNGGKGVFDLLSTSGCTPVHKNDFFTLALCIKFNFAIEESSLHYIDYIFRLMFKIKMFKLLIKCFLFGMMMCLIKTKNSEHFSAVLWLL